MDKTALEKINGFTRREFTEDELYSFSVILCDNEIDRDGERFSDGALERLKTLFIGKTGIFDHDPSTTNQTARIYDTELVTDDSRTTKNGEPYRYLRASAYMIRTDDNKNLIAEIDGGIKKEVSISCAASKRICSVCGRERTAGCSHVKGKSYGGKLCHTVLDEITDAYEWSFVAVPAQVNAGVTKRFTEAADEKAAVVNNGTDNTEGLNTERLNTERLLAEIRSLAFVRGGKAAVLAAEERARGMDAAQLDGLKKAYEGLNTAKNVEVQLMPDTAAESSSAFKI